MTFSRIDPRKAMMGAGFSGATVARLPNPAPTCSRGRIVSKSATRSRRAGSEWRDFSASRRHRPMGSAAPGHPRSPRPRGRVHLLGSPPANSSLESAKPLRTFRHRRNGGTRASASGGGDCVADIGLAAALSLYPVGGMAGCGGVRHFRGGDWAAHPARREAPVGPPARTGWRLARMTTCSRLERLGLLPSHPS